MGQDGNSPRACFSPAPTHVLRKYHSQGKTKHPIVPENKSKGGCEAREKEQNPRARTNISFFFFFYPKTDLAKIPTSTLKLLLLKKKNKQTKPPTTLKHCPMENQGKHCWELKSQSGRERMARESSVRLLH